VGRTRAAALDDVKPGCLLGVEVEGRSVCLARLDSGEVYAIAGLCTHEDYGLSDGDLQGRQVECPMHGSRFDVETGAVSGLPANRPVATFPVTVEGGDIFVDV
jgi:3-phenylpropionate/trans-cinnamate dioxygenase ferredoxin subunit